MYSPSMGLNFVGVSELDRPFVGRMASDFPCLQYAFERCDEVMTNACSFEKVQPLEDSLRHFG